MSFINVPNKITRKDIKYCGNIYKGNGFSYILSDLENKDIEKTLNLNGYGWYNYIYKVYDTYLFIIGNQIRNKDINIKNIDFISKVLKFEYYLHNNDKRIMDFDIPSNILTIISNERWLDGSFLKDYTKRVDYIINKNKPSLKGIQQPYERYMRFVCDNPYTNMGLFKNGLSMNLLTGSKIKLMKDTSIDGYIIKYDLLPFSS